MKFSACIFAAVFAAAPTTGAHRVLMVLTSHDKLGEKEGDQTGWYLPEAAHPYEVFNKAGVPMTWASPKGGEAPVDEGSVEAYKKDASSDAFMHVDVWKHTTALSLVNLTSIDAVFVVGGYGVMWDLVGNEDLERIVAAIWKSGGIVSGVCHGPAALVGVSLGKGKSLVKGKEVACFSNDEEDALKRKELVPETCEDAFKEAGAEYTKTEPWGEHVAVQGRLITGQNPASAKATAEAVVSALEKMEKTKKTEEEKMDMNMPMLDGRIPNSSRLVAAVACCSGFVAVVAVGLRIITRRRQVGQVLSEAIVNTDDAEMAE